MLVTSANVVRDGSMSPSITNVNTIQSTSTVQLVRYNSYSYGTQGGG